MTIHAKMQAHFTDGAYPDHSILRELMSYEMLFEQCTPLVKQNEFGAVKIEAIPSIHWSRQYELPWAIEAANLKPSDVVLDAGCGFSAFKLAVAKRVKRVVGIDIVLESLKKARIMCDTMGLNNVHLMKCDISQYESECQFDKIFCLSVLEHEPSNTNRMKCIDNLIKLLKPGGILLLSYDILLPDSEVIDIFIDQEKSNEILNKIGQKNVFIHDAKFHAIIGQMRIVSVCTTYIKPL